MVLDIVNVFLFLFPLFPMVMFYKRLIFLFFSSCLDVFSVLCGFFIVIIQERTGVNEIYINLMKDVSFYILYVSDKRLGEIG